jgi:hypothetical protein
MVGIDSIQMLLVQGPEGQPPLPGWLWLGKSPVSGKQETRSLDLELSFLALASLWGGWGRQSLFVVLYLHALPPLSALGFWGADCKASWFSFSSPRW